MAARRGHAWLAMAAAARAAILDDGYDCRLRHLADDYARGVVLREWPAARAARAAALVAEGLNLAECDAPAPTPGPPTPPPPPPTAPPVPRGACGPFMPDVNFAAGCGMPCGQEVAKVANATACRDLCRADPACNYWTWHDATQGSYANVCWNRYDPEWPGPSAGSPGHTSGECNHTLPRPGGTAARRRAPAAAAAAVGEVLYVHPTEGDDAAPGGRAAPLRSIAGAQARIRAAHPDPASRPRITVYLRGGTYHNTTVRFSAADSGAAPGRGIVYAAAPGADGEPEAAVVSGGVDLNSLGVTWAAAAPAGAFRAVLPAAFPAPDAQDQLFVAGRAMVRARVPNGRPWVPLDGFNLTAGRDYAATHAPLPDVPAAVTDCAPSKSEWPPAPPVPRGQCGAALPGVSLIAGAPAGSCRVAALTENATACRALCGGDWRCNFWTWHDAAQGDWALKCYTCSDQSFRYQPTPPGHTSGVCNHTLHPGGAEAPYTCRPAVVVCNRTNATQCPLGHASSTWYLGVRSGSAADLGSVVRVADCLEHIRVDRDWPIDWRAASFGYQERDNATHTWINKMDDTHNLPCHYGPWAGGMLVDTSQDAGIPLGSLTWPRPSDVVVHAMADGEWGGVQFRVADALVRRTGAGAVLQFQYGGWQQARTALLYQDRAEKQDNGNRFYMEGAAEFLDAEGEWVYDAAAHALTVFPPADLNLTAAALRGAEVVLTQKDRLFEFVGDAAGHVRHVGVANLTLAYTSAQFFRPHEESSGGDYAVHRGGAVFAENAVGVSVVGSTFSHIGGNAVFLSNDVTDARVSGNLFRFVGTSGVSVVGRTGAALGDGRDGAAMAARHGAARDNGARFPQRNTIDHNVFADYGVWDKQSACFHRALALDNVFLNNICFNSSRHAINYQDSFGGGGRVEGNLVFNLNRETRDTSAFNSWGRRTYLMSDAADPAVPRLVPSAPHSWRRNLVLNRNYHGAGYQDNGNALRCDDGASWFNLSGNVMYNAGVQFNGGSQVFSHGNVFIRGGWTLCSFLDVGGSSDDTYVDTNMAWASVCGSGDGGEADRCAAMRAAPPAAGQRAATYFGDRNVAVQNSTGRAARVDWTKYWCRDDLAAWRRGTGQDAATVQRTGGAEYTPAAVVELARRAMFAGAA